MNDKIFIAHLTLQITHQYAKVLSKSDMSSTCHCLDDTRIPAKAQLSVQTHTSL